MNPTTHVFQVKEEAENASVVFKKFEINGTPCAVSGKVCQIEGTNFRRIYALNEYSSEAAFVNAKGELQSVNVDRAVASQQISLRLSQFQRQNHGSVD